MKPITRWLISLSLAIILVGAAVLFLGVREGYFTFLTPDPSLTQSKEAGHFIRLVTIDTGETWPITLQTVLNGKSPIFAVNAKLNNANAPDDAPTRIVDGIIVLAELDKVYDTWLEPTDPDFKHLELVTLIRGGRAMRVHPITDSAIKAIYLSPAFVDAAYMQDEWRFRSPAGHVVLADGSRRSLWVVVVPKDALPIR